MSNFPPFRAAPPKSDKRKEPEDLQPVAAELERLLTAEKSEAMGVPEDIADRMAANLSLDAPSEEAQHVEHVRCCAKCFSTEVVEAVRIGDAVYIKVS